MCNVDYVKFEIEEIKCAEGFNVLYVMYMCKLCKVDYVTCRLSKV